MPTLQARLKQERKRQGHSQSALAALCDVSQPTIANWERGGQVPRQQALNRLAESLDVDAAWLLTGMSTADAYPAQTHLAKPIRHVPVFDWPETIAAFLETPPRDYLTLSLEREDVFAVISPDGAGFQAQTVLVFDRHDQSAGTHLLAEENGYSLEEKESPTTGSLGRLIYSIQPH
ncbi:helix-turn-helix domain-containing protein [Litorimonas sp. RW-G-Af-16]|uniref:helix-turn-helix domain-containing protein n=1 Tax=Litorimonas sp. RW-G-Af-16 TaxID=3241168 RepID=UPI00390C9EAC